MQVGVYHFGNWSKSCRRGYCSTCCDARLFLGGTSLAVCHVYFVPVLPYALKERTFCQECNREPNANRPSHPRILMAGIATGLCAIATGVAVFLELKDPAALFISLFGLFLVVALAWTLRKNTYREYQKTATRVAPLDGKLCPICFEPLFQHVDPECVQCGLIIKTERR